MTRVVVSPEIRKQLMDFTRPLELVDESGRVVANLTPKYHPSEWEQTVPQTSREELDRRMQEEDYSLEEVFDHIKKMEKA